MDWKISQPGDETQHCRVCGHFGTPKCSFDDVDDVVCESFLTWSELCQREMAAIKRAQRATYIVAGLAAAIAIIVMILPSLFG